MNFNQYKSRKKKGCSGDDKPKIKVVNVKAGAPFTIKPKGKCFFRTESEDGKARYSEELYVITDIQTLIDSLKI